MTFILFSNTYLELIQKKKQNKKPYKKKQYKRNNTEENSITINTSHTNPNVEISENIDEAMYNLSFELIQTSTSRINSCDNTLNITIEQFAEKIAKTSALFVASLYSTRRPSLSRVLCQEMINSTKTFLIVLKL